MKNARILQDSLMVESLLETLTKRRSQAFCKLTDDHSVTNAFDESFSSMNMWNIVKLLGKYDFPRVSVGNILKEKKLFPAKMNRYRFDLILVRRYWNSSNMENLRCLYSAVNEIILQSRLWNSKKGFFRQGINPDRNT